MEDDQPGRREAQDPPGRREAKEPPGRCETEDTGPETVESLAEIRDGLLELIFALAERMAPRGAARQRFIDTVADVTGAQMARGATYAEGVLDRVLDRLLDGPASQETSSS